MIRKFVLIISIVLICGIGSFFWRIGIPSETKRELVHLKDLAGDTKPFLCVSFSADGKCLAAGNADSTIKIWDTSTWNEIKTLKGHTGKVHCVTFSPDSRYLASASSDKTIKIWSTSKWGEVTTFKIQQLPYLLKPKTIAFSSDGRYFASADGSSVKIWDAVNWSEKTILYMPRRGIRGELNFDAISFSGDGKYLAGLSGALSSNGAIIRIWDIESWKVFKDIFSGSSWCISFSSDGRYFAFDDNCKVRVLNSDNWTEVVALNCWRATTYIGFNPKNGSLLVTNGVRRCPFEISLFGRVGLQLWSVKEWKKISEYQVYDRWRIKNRRSLWERRGIWDADNSSDGKFIAAVLEAFKNHKNIMIFAKEN